MTPIAAYYLYLALETERAASAVHGLKRSPAAGAWPPASAGRGAKFRGRRRRQRPAKGPSIPPAAAAAVLRREARPTVARGGWSRFHPRANRKEGNS